MRPIKWKAWLNVGRDYELLFVFTKLGKIAFGSSLLGKIVKRTRMIFP